MLTRSRGGQTVLTMGGMVFLQILNFAATLALARYLGPEGIGRYQLAVAVGYLLSIGTKLGLDEGLSYALPGLAHERAPNRLSIAAYGWGTSVLASLLVGAAVALVAEPLNETVFRLEGFAADLRTLAVLLPALVSLLVGLSVLRGIGRSDLRAWVYYVGVGSLFLLGVLVVVRVRPTSPVALWVRAGSFVAGAAATVALVAYLLGGERGAPRSGQLRSLHRLSGVLLLASSVQYLLEQSLVDLTLVSRFGSAEDVGVYGVAGRVGALALLVFSSVTVVFGPRFAEMAEDPGTAGALEGTYRRVARWVVALSGLVVGCMLAGRTGLLSLFGAEFLAGGHVLAILAGGYFLATLAGPAPALLIAVGRADLELKVSVFSLAVMVALGVFLGRVFGMTGVALGTAAGVATGAAIRFVLLERRFERSLFDLHLTKILAAFLLAVGVVEWARAPLVSWLGAPLLHSILLMTGFTVVFSGLLLLLRPELDARPLLRSGPGR